jgi:small-conductance mechanosensitive channel
MNHPVLQDYLSDLFDGYSMNLATIRDLFIDLGLRILVAILAIALFTLIGRYLGQFLKVVLCRFLPKRISKFGRNLIDSVRQAFTFVGTLLLIAFFRLALIFKPYPPIYHVLELITEIALLASISWLLSRILRHLIALYGATVINRLGQGINELLLVFETIANIFIWLSAGLIYAQANNINVVGLLTGLGIGGLAVAFAAQKTLEQLLGTVVIYLDSPFKPGEYIRLPSEDLFGRVESIGLRSTKIRTAAKNTLLIVPNSIMANLEIENVTRGKKIMVLLYLDFIQRLGEREKALVQQVVLQSTNTIYGIDPGSTSIVLLEDASQQKTRARVSFFILGSTENSIELRKRLLEFANDRISDELKTYGIRFDALNEPTIYVESPITI